jgi:hypothetical protein
MRLGADYNEETNQITLTVLLAPDSHLGAGDFIIGFDPNLLRYVSYRKGVKPTFFNVNDKNAEMGQLKFHIISTTDILDEEMVLIVVFNVEGSCQTQSAEFTLTGSGLSNALTDPIVLNFIGTGIFVRGVCIDNDANGKCDGCNKVLVCYGDCDGDEKVNLTDILLLRKYLSCRNPFTGEYDASIATGADVNGDGKISLKDAMILRRYLANRNPITGESTVVLGP